jgi:NitT/TauT family transport system substrate-binding protein
VAEAKGFLDDVSFNYEIYKGGPEVLKQVANGSADIGFAQPTDVMITNLATGGEPLPVKYWYMLETHGSNQIAVPEDSDIQSVADIKGKAIGISSPTASNVVQFRHVLELYGIDPDNDVVWRPVGLGAGHMLALRDGTVQISATNNMRHASYIQNGLPLRVIPVPELDGHFGNALFSSNEMLASEDGRAALVKIAKGMAEATQFCEANAEECVQLVFERFPEVMSTEFTDEQNMAFGLGQAEARNATAALREDQEGHYGYFPESVWTSSVDFLVKTGTIPGALPVDELYTNEIVEAAGL